MANRQTKNELSKFEKACIKISESNKKFLFKSEDFSSDESDSDDVSNSEMLLDKVFMTYTGLNKTTEDLTKTKQYLQDVIQSGNIVCLVCISAVKKVDPIWNCLGCYTAFHLTCLQKWARDSMQLKPEGFTEDTDFWYCPKCRYKYKKEECPTKYYCYCGQLKDPTFDPWLVPHSCGQVCDRMLKPDCGHRCNILCHPGPCPPCPQMVTVTCNCSQEKAQARRCSNRQWSCNRICKKLLSCKHHTCQDKCHSGACAKCEKRSNQFCICGQKKENRDCTDTIWQCDKECGKVLSCGFHNCQTVCHRGACGDCPRSKVRSCPCGKNKLVLPCNEEISPCGDTCGKLLVCGLHYCAQRCHTGDCGMCLQMRTRKCRCGLKEKSLPCYKEFLCDTKCKKLRDCGRHPCSRKCCDGECPSCEQVCGRTLNCGNHKCSSRCHTGLCYPCPVMKDNVCRCGKTKIRIPCGRKNVTPPKCNQPCELPPACHHSKIQKHRCHFGDCPQCLLACSQTMNCGHVCPARCHSAVSVKIEIKKERAGPWEAPIPPKIEVVCQSCPPCQFPIATKCMGEHEVDDKPCFESKKAFSCQRKCGKSLRCGNHFCEMICHKVGTALSLTEAGEYCSPCESVCSLKRPPGCPHPCGRPCHPKPCPPCRLMVQSYCHCQINKLLVDCFKWTSCDESEKLELLSCKDRCPKLMTCGHRCILKCHLGQCTESGCCKKKVVVRCKCKRIKQEFSCNQVFGKKDVVSCDVTCQEKIEEEAKRKRVEQAKLEKEEKEKNMRELELFQRKMDGKKKKHKKVKETEVKELPFWRKNIWILSVSLIIAICSFGFIYFTR